MAERLAEGVRWPYSEAPSQLQEEIYTAAAFYARMLVAVNVAAEVPHSDALGAAIAEFTAARARLVQVAVMIDGWLDRAAGGDQIDLRNWKHERPQSSG